ncbi:MAG: FAD-dependent oxidoreductase, partial [Armatimonadetes bacterium]|nr:FAD-dependent oxidoreductase [Armatimonadota bacterium]
EGSNLAMTSAKLAAEAVLRAKQRGDFSAKTLSHYDQLLRESHIYKDLYKYRNMTRFFERHPEFFALYPELLNEAAREMLTVDGTTKRAKQRRIFWDAMRKRKPWTMARDFFGGWRSIA